LKQFPNSKPLLDCKSKANAVDELVCFQEAQTLPLFLIVPKTKPTFTPMTEKPAFNLVSQAPPRPQTSDSATSPSIMTRASFEKLKSQALIDYLLAQGVDLDGQRQDFFRQQDINGGVLLDWAWEDLGSAGLSKGLATMILKRIPKE